MEWNHSTAIGLAKTGCVHCNGLGLRDVSRASAEHVCKCVLREVFRVCYNRFKSCVASQGRTGTVSWDASRKGADSRKSYGRKSEEYAADFCLVSARALTPEDHKIFRYHYLLGGDWKLCCRQLKMERGNFFHAIYRIEAKLGKLFSSLEPFAMYPLDDYFGNVVKRDTVPTPQPPAPAKHVLCPPMRMPDPVDAVADVYEDEDGYLQRAA